MSQAIYRDFDSEAMERQYNPRQSVDGVDEIVADWSSHSRAFTA